MPSLTTEYRLPDSACRRRAKTSGQRSSPFSVDAEPSVMESPKATITRLPDGAVMYTASRKYHDVDDSGNASSLSSLERNPAPGIDRYDVVIAFACHVIGPLSPATWKLTARRRPTSIGSAGSLTNGNDAGSDTASAPGAIVTDGWPAKVTGRLVPASTAAPLFCRPRYTPSKVAGFVPNAFDRRMRAWLPQTSGRTISRNDWSLAPRAASGKANFISGCAAGKPAGYGPCADAAQAATQCGAVPGAVWATATWAMTTLAKRHPAIQPIVNGELRRAMASSIAICCRRRLRLRLLRAERRSVEHARRHVPHAVLRHPQPHDPRRQPHGARRGTTNPFKKN